MFEVQKMETVQTHLELVREDQEEELELLPGEEGEAPAEAGLLLPPGGAEEGVPHQEARTEARIQTEGNDVRDGGAEIH